MCGNYPDVALRRIVVTASEIAWQVECWAAIGASHTRAGKCSQDYGKIETRDNGRVLIAAVADGHGSRKCFRSDRGSRFAVEVAHQHLGAYVEIDTGIDRITTIRDYVELDLPQRITREWQQRVDDDLATFPLNATELASLSEAERTGFNTNPRIAYGTTLVASLILPECAVYLQLGDGDVLVVSGDGEGVAPVRPLPGDPRSFANDTASLSSTGPTANEKRPSGGGGPWSDFRVGVVPIMGKPPALVLLTTDGYPNAFVNDAAFCMVATDILFIIKNEGWDFVRKQMPAWLEEASRQGSGDDVTVAIAVRLDLVGSTRSSTLLGSDVSQSPENRAEPLTDEQTEGLQPEQS